jgi:hypothetical protein
MKRTADGDMALSLTTKVFLMGGSGGAFAGDAQLAVIGSMNEDSGRSSWQFKRVDVGRISLSVDQGAFSFFGQLNFYKQDATFGDGFQGAVQAEFRPGIKVQANAIFGNVQGMRYWYVDALGSFPTGIPIFPGVGIYGFGGGAYYRMKQAGYNESSMASGGNFRPGQTLSGIIYKPDAGTALGIKASVKLGTHPVPEAFNGTATFEVAFNNNGGVNTISFNGEAKFITPPIEINIAAVKKAAGRLSLDKEKAQPVQTTSDEVGITAKVYLAYDIPNSTLTGNLQININADPVLKGGGVARVKFSPQEWYIMIGTPDQRIGIDVLSVARADGYLMMGNSIPGMPPLPSRVQQIRGQLDAGQQRDDLAAAKGGGVAFGASMGFDTGYLEFAPFYARFAMGVGFDIMIKNYGPTVRCRGSSSPIGINGWYAMGQAYAFVEGDIGIRVRFWGRTIDAQILSLGLAAVLEARLPNPVWFRGSVYGRYNVLGGLISGNCAFQITYGNLCELEGGSVLNTVRMIADMKPADNEQEVNVFTSPQAVFNMPVGREFRLMDVDNRRKDFRAKLNTATVFDGQSQVAGNLTWNDERTVVSFESFDVLPPKKQLRFKVEVGFEESTNGNWQPVMVDGRAFTETKEITFTTGTAPDNIPASNVAYSYPIATQANYYLGENSTGYIRLKRGQPYLFEPNADFDQLGRVRLNDKTSPVLFNIAYNSGDRQVNYQLPVDKMKLGTVYEIELVNLPKYTGQAVDRNVKSQEEKVTTGESETRIKTQYAEGTIKALQEKTIYNAFFRTSQFNTLAEKFQRLQRTSSFSLVQGFSARAFRILRGGELLDKFELVGAPGVQPLVRLEANLVNNAWYRTQAEPIVYGGYPLCRNCLVRRDTSVLGLPPVRAMQVFQSRTDAALPADRNANVDFGNSFFGEFYGQVQYDLGVIGFVDYSDISSAVFNYYVNGGIDLARVNLMWRSRFPDLTYTSYEYRGYYTLPGQTRPNSSFDSVIDNTIR